MSLIFKDNCIEYSWEMKLALLSKLNKTEICSFLWFSLTFHVMHLNVSKSWTKDLSTRSFLLLVTSTEVLAIIASFFLQDPDIY